MTDEFDDVLAEPVFENETNVVTAPQRNTNWTLIISLITILLVAVACVFGINAIRASNLSLASLQQAQNTEVAQESGVEEQIAIETVIVTEEVLVTVEVPVEVMVTPDPAEMQRAADEAYNQGVTDGIVQAETDLYGFPVLEQDGVFPFDQDLPAMLMLMEHVEENGQMALSTIRFGEQLNSVSITRLTCDDECLEVTFVDGATGKVYDLTSYLNMMFVTPGCSEMQRSIAEARGINCTDGEILAQSGQGIFLGNVTPGSLLQIRFRDDQNLGVNNGTFIVLSHDTMPGDVTLTGEIVTTPTFIPSGYPTPSE